jgi:hypothetical protein
MTEPFGALDEAVEEAGTMKKAAFEVALKSKRQIAGGTMAFVFEKPRGLKVKSGHTNDAHQSSRNRQAPGSYCPILGYRESKKIQHIRA